MYPQTPVIVFKNALLRTGKGGSNVSVNSQVPL